MSSTTARQKCSPASGCPAARLGVREEVADASASSSGVESIMPVSTSTRPSACSIVHT
jgi:hypothetical protein